MNKREMGLCDVNKCYEKASVKLTTGGGTELFVCEDHNSDLREEMGFPTYSMMKPERIRSLGVVCCFTIKDEEEAFFMEIKDNKKTISKLLKGFSEADNFHTVGEWKTYLRGQGCKVREIVPQLFFDF